MDEDSSDTSVRPGLPQGFLAWIHSEMVHITPREVLAEQLGTLDENVILLNVFFLLRLKKKNPANLAFSLSVSPSGVRGRASPDGWTKHVLIQRYFQSSLGR